MAALVWDKVGERIYQAGVDRGVLYLQDGSGVVWNGLLSVEESVSTEISSYYLDGVKYLQTLSTNDFSAKLKAYTYPDEFESVNGVIDFMEGLELHDQPSESFNLSYRTKIGNDIDGLDHGYKIHILYNVIASPDAYSFETLDDSGISPIAFGWTLTGTPPEVVNFKPTVHVTIDSTKTPVDVLKIVEDRLYGTVDSNPSIPTIQELAEYFGYLGALIIIDHGDGTWSAIDESETYITMLSETMFQIDNADAYYIETPLPIYGAGLYGENLYGGKSSVDFTIYRISSTNV